MRSAAEDSWEQVSAIDFAGWGPCTTDSRGVRIRIQDSGPHVKSLGGRLDGYVDGMVLNFTFLNWSPSCQSMREFCIRAIAVHEFGHALGFAHEQNRPDTPSWCNEEQGSNGTLVIEAWDLDSVMNYCNPNWNGNGQLSATDTLGVIQMYGPPPWVKNYGYTAGGWRTELHPRMMADVNGDGRQDVVGFANTGVYVQPF